MTRTTTFWTWLPAAGLLGAVALLASSCGSGEVPSVDATDTVPRHHPMGDGVAAGCFCEFEGHRLFCGVCEATDECICCGADTYCPTKPCDVECTKTSVTFLCPSDYPNDCGDGTCCPNDHPSCCPGGMCGPRDEIGCD